MVSIQHFKCPECGKEFDKEFHSRRELERCKGFCSQACANKRTLRGKIKTVPCSICSKPTTCGFRSNPKLVKCESCRKHKTGKDLANLDPQQACACVICGGPTTWRYPTCSRACGSKLKRQKIIEDFNLGRISQRGTLRKILRDLRGWRCSDCSIEMWRDVEAPLEVDHIDGDPTNNSPENVRLLCPNCHALTPTWGSRNRGRGRKARGLAQHF